MQKIIFLYLHFLFFFFSKSYILNNYFNESIDKLPKYSKNKILVLKGKKNHTKCISARYLNENETIFIYKNSEVLTSESCFYPNKTGLIYNISYYTNRRNDTIKKSRYILTFCIYYLLTKNKLNKDNFPMKKLVELLPIEDNKYNEAFLEDNILNELLLTGNTFKHQELEDLINIGETMFFDVFNFSKPNFKLYTHIYYYVLQHTFYIKEQSVLFPYLDVCNIYPLYLTIQNKNFTNSTILYYDGEKFLFKVTREFRINEQYLFGYPNQTYSNDELMEKNGKFIKNNKYDIYLVQHIFKFEQNSQINEFLKYLNQTNFNLKLLKYVVDRKKLFLTFPLNTNELNTYVMRFSFIYFNWRRKQITKNNENKNIKYIVKQTFLFYWKLIRNEFKRLFIFMKGNNIRNYLKDYNNESNEKMKYLKEFTLERINNLYKNFDFIYPQFLRNSWKRLENTKNRYIIIDPNEF
jgi:hypothetical protein